MNILYVPVGTPTYDLETAKVAFKESTQLLLQIDTTILIPTDILFSVETIEQWVTDKNPDLIILQHITFANAESAIASFANFTSPILLWTLREPVHANPGGRLSLNSLTGAFSAANALHAFNKENFEYVFGAPTEKTTKTQISAAIAAARVKKELASLSIAAIGQTPQGFGFGRALDAEIRQTFGCKLISVEARELMKKAENITDKEINQLITSTAITATSATYTQKVNGVADFNACCSGITEIPDKNTQAYYKLQKAYDDFVRENNIGALASRCWPDFFTEYGTPVCAVLSMLNNMGIPATGEADVYGALTMYIATRLSTTSMASCENTDHLEAAFFGDPVAMDEKTNTITYWHCGMAAPSLAQISNTQNKAPLGVHPNRKIGPVMDFGCRPAKEATVIRVGRTPDAKFRMFVCKGEVIDAPKQYQGTSVVFKPKNSALEIVKTAIHGGWEPHYIVAFNDISLQVEMLSRMLNIEVCTF